MIGLLDVNVLLALAWSTHSHALAAGKWFESQKNLGWATCPVTQSGFLRVSTTIGAVGRVVMMNEARSLLSQVTAEQEHVFWPMDTPATDVHPSIRMLGPKHMTDCLLLDLAIRRDGKLVTFDQKIRQLLPAGSPLLKHIELLVP